MWPRDQYTGVGGGLYTGIGGGMYTGIGGGAYTGIGGGMYTGIGGGMYTGIGGGLYTGIGGGLYTGIGGGLYTGIGGGLYTGLTHGFMYAGVPRVVVSLWSVNDRSTADLMKHFYEAMLAKGQRPSAALRSAQLQLMQSKQWQSPYYWAAFGLQGEWR